MSKEIDKENGFWRYRKSFGLPPPNALQNSQLSTNAPKVSNCSAEAAPRVHSAAIEQQGKAS